MIQYSYTICTWDGVIKICLCVSLSFSRLWYPIPAVALCLSVSPLILSVVLKSKWESPDCPSYIRMFRQMWPSMYLTFSSSIYLFCFILSFLLPFVCCIKQEPTLPLFVPVFAFVNGKYSEKVLWGKKKCDRNNNFWNKTALETQQ